MTLANSFVAELDKLCRRPATWVIVAGWATMSIMFAYVVPYTTYTGAPADRQPALLVPLLPDQMIGNVLSGFPVFGGAIALVLGALVVGSEFGWGTLKTVLVQQPNRTGVWFGKLLALSVLVFMLVIATFLPDAVSSYAIATIENAPVNWPSAWKFTRALGIGWLVLAIWAALGAALATLLRNSSLAIGLGLVYLLIERLIVGLSAQSDLLAAVSKALPGTNAGSVVAALATSAESDTPGVVAVVGPTQATLVLAAYVLGFAVLSTLVFLKRDVT